MKPPDSPLRRRRRWVLVACILSSLSAFTLTHLPSRRLPRVSIGDWLLHAAGYFALVSLLVAVLIAYGLGRARRIILVLCLAAAYAAFDEITQPLVGRVADLGDWLADMAGTTVAAAVWELSLVAAQRRAMRRRGSAAP
jgi:VanZ family protein